MELALGLSELYFGRESGMWLSLGGFQEKGPDDSHLYNTHVVIDDSGKLGAHIEKYICKFNFHICDENFLSEIFANG